MKWLYRKFGTEDFRSFVAYCMGHDAHPFIQFVKYGIAGGLSTVAFALTVAACETWLFPVTKESKWNFTVNASIGFVISCVVAYVTNILWVFKPGRHSRRKEVTLFFAAALLAFFIGTPLGQFLVSYYNWVGPMMWAAVGVTIVSSVMVNYTCRKFFIFKG